MNQDFQIRHGSKHYRPCNQYKHRFHYSHHRSLLGGRSVKSYEPMVYWKFVWSFMKQWSRACDRYFFCITVCKPQNDEKIPAYGMACFPCCLLYFLILCNPRHYLNSHVSEKLCIEKKNCLIIFHNAYIVWELKHLPCA